MKMNTHHDIIAPIETVFGVLADTKRWERASLRRGMQVTRKDEGAGLVMGATWDVKATFRGKPREVTLVASTVTRPNQIVLAGMSNLFDATISIDLIELSARKTRVSISVETKPNTLAARIMLQSAKFAKSSIQKRFVDRVGKILAELDERITYEM